MTTSMPDPEYRPKWENRRRTIFGTLLFCAGIILYLTIWGGGENIDLHKTIVQFAFLTAGAVVGSYVFGAVWQDVRIQR